MAVSAGELAESHESPPGGSSRNAPIALFAYNRPQHTQQTVQALQLNELARETELFVFCDGPRTAAESAAVQQVRDYAHAVTGFKSTVVIERELNFGLAESVISGVTTVCGDYGRVIVVEDDLQTSPYFLQYMNAALRMYEDDPAVGSIHGYWYPVHRPLQETFFLRGASCWGWATWSRAWRLFERDGRKLLAELQRRNLTRRFDLEGAIPYTQMLKDQIFGRNNSWAIRWHATMFLADCLQLSPGTSLVRNIGFDGSGTHRVQSDAYAVELGTRPIQVSRIAPQESAEARAALIQYYRNTRRSLPVRVLNHLRRVVGI